MKFRAIACIFSLWVAFGSAHVLAVPDRATVFLVGFGPTPHQYSRWFAAHRTWSISYVDPCDGSRAAMSILVQQRNGRILAGLHHRTPGVHSGGAAEKAHGVLRLVVASRCDSWMARADGVK